MATRAYLCPALGGSDDCGAVCGGRMRRSDKRARGWVMTRILAMAEAFAAGASQHDDMTLVVVKVSSA